MLQRNLFLKFEFSPKPIFKKERLALNLLFSIRIFLELINLKMSKINELFEHLLFWSFCIQMRSFFDSSNVDGFLCHIYLKETSCPLLQGSFQISQQSFQTFHWHIKLSLNGIMVIKITQVTFTCSKSAVETLQEDVKCIAIKTPKQRHICFTFYAIFYASILTIFSRSMTSLIR